MTDIIIVAVLAAILVPAVRYIYKAKKRGVKCIGCSVEGACPHGGGSTGCGCGCGGADTE